jgi:CIC family chloride channel protein
MMTCIISAVTASQLKRESIYTMKLIRRGINVRAGKEISILKSMLVQDYMVRNVVPISENLSLNDLLHLIKEATSSYFPVLNSKEELVGILSLRDIRPVLLEEGLMNLVIAKDIMTEAVITVRSGQNLYDAMEKFGSKDIDQLPVVHKDNLKKVIGMLKRADVIAAYNNAVLERGIEKK